MCCDIWVCGHPPPQLSCGSLSYEGEEAPQRSHPVRGSVRALKRAPRVAPRVWSDLDRSTVWAETAGSSRFLHMGLTREIGAADEAIRCGCHFSNSSVRASVRSAWWRADVSRWRCKVRPNGSSHCRLREMTPTFYGFIRRICISGQCHVKESTRYGRLSPHSAPIEVGPHPRRHPQCPLERSNGARTAFSEESLRGEVGRTDLLLIVLEGRATTRDLRAADPA